MDPTDATTVVDKAAQHGWEAAMVALTLVSCLVLFGFVIRHMLKNQTDQTNKTLEEAKNREERLAARVDKLEKVIEDDLMTMANRSIESITSATEVNRELVSSFKRLEAVVVESHRTTAELCATLRSRPCAAEELIKLEELLNRSAQVINTPKTEKS
jgi:hypothetical protein